MTTLIIFLVLTGIEYLYYRFKVSEIEDVHGIAGFLAGVAGKKEGFDRVTNRVLAFLINLRSYLLWPVVGLILIANLIVASILSWTWTLIMLLISLF